MVPEPVHQRIQEDWFNWQNSNIPVIEIGHRTDDFLALMEKTEQNLRHLLNIPANYNILFLQGGARGQFALVPMNLLGKNHQADYLVYGLWSEQACLEAQKYGDINRINILQSTDQLGITDQSEWSLNANAAYLHYCSNETISGMCLKNLPKSDSPLVADMSSDILSKPIDVSQFGLIYACFQKNLGIAGLTLIILRDNLLNQSIIETPSVFNYCNQCHEHSLYNTLPTFSYYVMSLIIEWMQQEGGITAIALRNQEKADMLYRIIDHYGDFYLNSIDPLYRSLMNVTFSLKNKNMERQFLLEAEQHGLLYLKGHPSFGGLRASIYNAMPIEGVAALATFMRIFAEKNTTSYF